MSQWQTELKNSITSYTELFKLINLNNELVNKLIIHNKFLLSFPLLVTRSFINRISHNDINDPLLLQILPSNKEIIIDHNYLDDPLREKDFNKIPGLIHKYQGRVLLLANKACAIHCRYCFRQHFPYSSNIASGKNLIDIINYIKQDNSISEIILSGGDPLLAPNNYFQKLLSVLNPIDHITTIRIHSRIPIVLPSRLEPELINLLLNSRFNIIIVTHSNHPNELNPEVTDSFKVFQNTRVVLLNQSVLLKNVNDNADVLAELSKKLFNNLRVLPYYLHILDHVNGAKHFEVDFNQAKKIFKQLTGILPGYLAPRLVVERPEEKSKVILCPNCHQTNDN